MGAALVDSDYEIPDWVEDAPPPWPPGGQHDLIRTAISNEKAGHVGNPYRRWQDTDLLDQKQYLEYCLMEWNLRTEFAHPAEEIGLTLEWHRHNHEQLERELNRRRNLMRDSGRRPSGQDMSKRAFVDLVAFKDQVRIEFAVDRLSVNHQLVPRGVRLWTCCFLPGHSDDDSPSFMVDPRDQHFYCFGCRRGGDVISLACHWFAQEKAPKAIELMCGLLGMDVPRMANHPVGPGPRVIDAKGRSIQMDPHLFRERKPARKW